MLGLGLGLGLGMGLGLVLGLVLRFGLGLLLRLNLNRHKILFNNDKTSQILHEPFVLISLHNFSVTPDCFN